MTESNYKKIFFGKILLGLFAIGLIFRRYIQHDQKLPASIVFLVDMQESISTKDIEDNAGLQYTRQQTAAQYIFKVVEHADTGTAIGIIRLGYYPDYLVPPTTDRKQLSAYIVGLASSPLSPNIIYETGDISLQKYLSMSQSYYVLISDKESTFTDIQKYKHISHTVFIHPGKTSISVHTHIAGREDMLNDISFGPQQSSYLPWIFVLITVVGGILL